MRCLALVLALLASCAPRRLEPATPYYLTRPAATAASDSTMERVLVYIDERTLIWLNAELLARRAALVEGAACLHIAKRMPPDGFKVDSASRATMIDPAPTWRSANFVCPLASAPIHYHVVTPALASWLQSQGDTTGFAIDARCTPSGADTSPGWSHFPFNAVMCGLGIDSLIVYRVKPRPLGLAGKADLGMR